VAFAGSKVGSTLGDPKRDHFGSQGTASPQPHTHPILRHKTQRFIFSIYHFVHPTHNITQLLLRLVAACTHSDFEHVSNTVVSVRHVQTPSADATGGPKNTRRCNIAQAKGDVVSQRDGQVRQTVIAGEQITTPCTPRRTLFYDMIVVSGREEMR
jgi:hypothetical protein